MPEQWFLSVVTSSTWFLWHLSPFLFCQPNSYTCLYFSFYPLPAPLLCLIYFALVAPPPFFPFYTPVAVVLHRGQLLGLRGKFSAICCPIILSLFTSFIFLLFAKSFSYYKLHFVDYIRSFQKDCIYLFCGCLLFCYHYCDLGPCLYIYTHSTEQKCAKTWC